MNYENIKNMAMAVNAKPEGLPVGTITRVVKETEKAILCFGDVLNYLTAKTKKCEFWLPKSQLTFSDNGVELPVWLGDKIITNA